MKFILSILALVCLALSLNAQTILELPTDFLTALHKQEASGRMNPPDGDDGHAIGPFQIWQDYWKDAVQYDKNLKGTYQDCRKFEYAKRVVTAYMNRYAKEAIRKGDYEALARLHNGGPSWNKRPRSIAKTKIYWESFQKKLTMTAKL